MINLFRKIGKVYQRGGATLIIALIMLVTSTLIILFAAEFGKMQDKIGGNVNRNLQAFEAAEAGLEYGINYLQVNYSTIIGAPVSGHINYTTAAITNVALGNSSKYSIVYTNPTANNYNLITITSTGVSDDGSSTRVSTQQVELGSLLSATPSLPIASKGNVSVSGNANVTNMESNHTIQSAGTVSFSGNGKTTTSAGSGTSGTDVQQNVASLQSESQNDFIASYFGTTNTATIISKVGHYYNSTGNTNYSSTLAGMTGTSIWIDQTGSSTATINGTTTIGSAANPVLLVVNGNLSLSGNVVIYGFVFVIGTNDILTLTGNTQITGGIATTDTLNMSGNIALTFSSSVINNLRSNPSTRYFAKIAGSWKDF